MAAEGEARKVKRRAIGSFGGASRGSVSGFGPRPLKEAIAKGLSGSFALFSLDKRLWNLIFWQLIAKSDHRQAVDVVWNGEPGLDFSRLEPPHLVNHEA